MPHPEPVARRMFDLVEPSAWSPTSPTSRTRPWRRSASRTTGTATSPGGPRRSACVPAEVVTRLFYNFADGEVARHIPRVWDTTTPEAALRGPASGAASRRCGGSSATSPSSRGRPGRRPPRHGGDQRPDRGSGPVRRAADAARPDEPVARLWHAANLLREHRGDGHIAALRRRPASAAPRPTCCTRSPAGSPAEDVRPGPPPARGPVGRGHGRHARPRPVGADGWLTAAGRETKERIEALTDELAEPAYDVLDARRTRPADRRPRADRRRAQRRRVELRPVAGF